MIRFKYVFFAMVVIALSSCSSKTSQGVKSDLTATEFAEKMKEIPDAIVLDVRTPNEFAGGHLAHAVNVNWDGNDFHNEIGKLDKAKPVFVYCLSGARSAAAANEMRSNGFKEVYEMSGGIMKWRAANLPLETVATTAAAESTASNGMTKAQFDALVNSDKVVLVDFYADWCQPCKKMEPYLNEISKEMADKVEVVRINADDNSQLCRELKVDALPYLHVYKNNKLTWSNMGFIGKEEVVKQL